MTQARRSGGVYCALAVAFALALAACTGPADAAGTDGAAHDPFAALDGKTDGFGEFFDRGRSWQVTITGAGSDADPDTGATDVRVAVEGPDADADYDDSSLYPWASAAGAANHRVRLSRGDRLAGMRSFLLRPVAAEEDVDALVDQASLHRAVGVAAPRVVRADVTIDGEDLGPHLLIEHVGDRFLRLHFDSDEGDVARDADSPWAASLAERLDADAATPWHLASILDVEAAAAALAVASVTDRAAGPTELAFYDPCGATPRPCLVPIPEVGAQVVDLASLRGTLLSQSRARRAWADALEALAACFDDGDCGESRETAALVAALIAAEAAADAPTGGTDYAPITTGDGDRLVIAFRHLEGAHAEGVTARIFDDGASAAAAPREVSMTLDRGRDLWTAELAPDGSFSYDFVVHGVDGTTRTVADPATAGTSPRAHQALAALDALTEVSRVSLDVREPSGLAMLGARLFVIGDEGDDIFEVDPDSGATIDRLDVGIHGIEGVAVDPVLGEFYVADEDRGLLARFSFSGERRGTLQFGWAEDAGGIEGLTMRARDGHVFFAKERSPSRIAEVTPDEELLRRTRIRWARDLSALAHSSDDDRLYALSDEDRRLYRLDDDFDVSAYWDLEIDKPEGLAIYQGRVYVVSDSTGELVVYELNRGRWAP